MTSRSARRYLSDLGIVGCNLGRTLGRYTSGSLVHCRFERGFGHGFDDEPNLPDPSHHERHPESSIFMGLSDHGNAAAMIVHLETE